MWILVAAAVMVIGMLATVYFTAELPEEGLLRTLSTVEKVLAKDPVQGILMAMGLAEEVLREYNGTVPELYKRVYLTAYALHKLCSRVNVSTVEVREKLSELRQVLSDAVAYERDPLRFITPVTVLATAMCILYITIQQAPEKR